MTGKFPRCDQRGNVPITALDVSADGTRYAAAYLDGTLVAGAWNEGPLVKRIHLRKDAEGRQQSLVTDPSVLEERSVALVANIGERDLFTNYASSGKTTDRIVSMELQGLEKASTFAASCSEALGQGVIALGMGDGRGVLLIDVRARQDDRQSWDAGWRSRAEGRPSPVSG